MLGSLEGPQAVKPLNWPPTPMCEKQALNEDLHIYNRTTPLRPEAPDAYGSHTVIGSGWRRIIYKDEVLNLETACKSSFEGRQVVKTLNWPPTHMSEKKRA